MAGAQRLDERLLAYPDAEERGALLRLRVCLDRGALAHGEEPACDGPPVVGALRRLDVDARARRAQREHHERTGVGEVEVDAAGGRHRPPVRADGQHDLGFGTAEPPGEDVTDEPAPGRETQSGIVALHEAGSVALGRVQRRFEHAGRIPVTRAVEPPDVDFPVGSGFRRIRRRIADVNRVSGGHAVEPPDADVPLVRGASQLGIGAIRVGGRAGRIGSAAVRTGSGVGLTGNAAIRVGGGAAQSRSEASHWIGNAAPQPGSPTLSSSRSNSKESHRRPR